VRSTFVPPKTWSVPLTTSAWTAEVRLGRLASFVYAPVCVSKRHTSSVPNVWPPLAFAM
jgi:hypothetical protein